MPKPSYNGLPISDQEAFNSVLDWIDRGCPADRTELTYRYQVTYPATYCRLWIRPKLRMWHVGRFKEDDKWVYMDEFVALDAHYDEKTGLFKAIGGLWVDRLKDFSIKPQQELKDNTTNIARHELYDKLRRLFPDSAPDRVTLRHYKIFDQIYHPYAFDEKSTFAWKP